MGPGGERGRPSSYDRPEGGEAPEVCRLEPIPPNFRSFIVLDRTGWKLRPGRPIAVPIAMDIFWLRERLDVDGIRRLVHRFYEAVQHEPMIGPIFSARIRSREWPAHLDKMVAFWSTILLGTGTYHGDPMAVHRTLDGVTGEHFDRWLNLFEATANAELGSEVGAAIVRRARRMGTALQASMP